jgi:hypothetical protein
MEEFRKPRFSSERWGFLLPDFKTAQDVKRFSISKLEHGYDL